MIDMLGSVLMGNSLHDQALKALYQLRPQQKPAPVRQGRKYVHTFYGGAQLFSAELCEKSSRRALEALQTYAATFEEFSNALGIEHKNQLSAEQRADLESKGMLSLQSASYAGLCYIAWFRMQQKLQAEPIEDCRIDFEDGFGLRSDEEEQQAAKNSAQELARALREAKAPPSFGVRIKPLCGSHAGRALRTLELFTTTLKENVSVYPSRLFVALPKAVQAQEFKILSEFLNGLESKLGLPANSHQVEIILETAQLLFGEDGQSRLPAAISSLGARACSLHLGMYDLTSQLGIASHAQQLRHPFCDFARFMMSSLAAGKDLRLVDSITHLIPVGANKAKPGETLAPEALQGNRQAVQRAWRVQFENIKNSLKQGFYQGWDLHPAQLPVRYFSTYLFFLEGYREAVARLGAFLRSNTGLSMSQNAFDDRASLLGVINLLQSARDCKALSTAELDQSGLKNIPTELLL